MKTIYTAENESRTIKFENKTLMQVIDDLVAIDDNCVWTICNDGKTVADITFGQYTIY